MYVWFYGNVEHGCVMAYVCIVVMVYIIGNVWLNMILNIWCKLKDEWNLENIVVLNEWSFGGNGLIKKCLMNKA